MPLPVAGEVHGLAALHRQRRYAAHLSRAGGCVPETQAPGERNHLCRFGQKAEKAWLQERDGSQHHEQAKTGHLFRHVLPRLPCSDGTGGGSIGGDLASKFFVAAINSPHGLIDDGKPDTAKNYEQ